MRLSWAAALSLGSSGSRPREGEWYTWEVAGADTLFVVGVAGGGGGRDGRDTAVVFLARQEADGDSDPTRNRDYFRRLRFVIVITEWMEGRGRAC